MFKKFRFFLGCAKHLFLLHQGFQKKKKSRKQGTCLSYLLCIGLRIPITGELSAVGKKINIFCCFSTNSVDVFFVDYGQTELKTIDSICANFPPNFKRWPPQAVRCSLAGIIPVSTISILYCYMELM